MSAGDTQTEARERQRRVIRGLLDKIEKQFEDDAVKATLGDYIKLLQLEKELEADAPREIRVRWVEAEERSESEE